jgi:hypothetical protein
MWIWILVGLAILLIVFYRSRENMTDKQLMDTLQTFEQKGKKSQDPQLDPIYGPSANPPAVPTNTGGGKNGKSTGGPYPQIFGPDTTPQLGVGRNGAGGAGGAGGTATEGIAGNGKTGESSVYVNPVGPGQVGSDQADPAEPEFNPDLKNAFPYDGPPQPFLTDFSKILH